jgi:hypothetical protein
MKTKILCTALVSCLSLSAFCAVGLHEGLATYVITSPQFSLLTLSTESFRKEEVKKLKEEAVDHLAIQNIEQKSDLMLRFLKLAKSKKKFSDKSDLEILEHFVNEENF